MFRSELTRADSIAAYIINPSSGLSLTRLKKTPVLRWTTRKPLAEDSASVRILDALALEESVELIVFCSPADVWGGSRLCGTIIECMHPCSEEMN